MLKRLLLAVAVWMTGVSVMAQSADELVVATVTRAPFSMVIDDTETGFSIALWDSLAADVGLDYRIQRYQTFGEMIDAVESGEADAAIANISITEEREMRLDFTQPIFDTGLQIMLRGDSNRTLTLIKSILTPGLFLAVAIFFVVTLSIGMVMWAFERRNNHPYFKGSAKEAAFPAFWWALNLIVSNGFEEDMPRSRMGRVFGTLMVICSLFLISILTANITAALTLNAISEDVSSISDLDGRKVGTTAGSTTSTYLDLRGIQHTEFETLEALLDAFTRGRIEAVVFDGPILAYWLQNEGPDDARLIERFFRREGYGIAVPEGSGLREPLDRALLRARESGEYDQLKAEWFGAAYSEG